MDILNDIEKYIYKEYNKEIQQFDIVVLSGNNLELFECVLSLYYLGLGKINESIWIQT